MKRKRLKILVLVIRERDTKKKICLCITYIIINMIDRNNKSISEVSIKKIKWFTLFITSHSRNKQKS